MSMFNIVRKEFQYGQHTVTLETGEYEIIDIQLKEVGTTDITYSGDGTLTIEYQERVL